MARILVVDDENNIRMMVRLALQHVGHTVTTAADGSEALEKFDDGSGFDLVLLDQRMPGMEGLDVLREMRHRDSHAQIVMATAFGTIDLAVEAMKCGATDFLRKPFTTEVLLGAVHSTLADPVPPERKRGITFGSTTINSFRIEFQAGTGLHAAGEFRQTFTVRSPVGAAEDCDVILPGYVMELVKAHTDLEHMPGGDRFWQALCEEALANYLWQHAEFPPGGEMRVEDFSTGLRRFVDVVLNE